MQSFSSDLEVISGYMGGRVVYPNPTQKNGQGPDLGEQYQSVIFYYILKQRDTAAKLLEQLAAKNI